MTESVNWADLIKGSKDAFEPLPVGTYDCIVDKCDAVKSSTGKLMFKVVFRVTGGPKTNSKIWNNITLTVDNPKATYMFFENMKALGITEQQHFSQNPPLSPATIAQLIVGKTARVTIDHREYMGKKSENVTNMVAISGFGGSGPMPGGMSPSPSVSPSPSPAPTPAAPAPAPVATPQPTIQPVAAVAPVDPVQPVAPVQQLDEATFAIPLPENPAPAETAPAPAAFTPPPPAPF